MVIVSPSARPEDFDRSMAGSPDFFPPGSPGMGRFGISEGPGVSDPEGRSGSLSVMFGSAELPEGASWAAAGPASSGRPAPASAMAPATAMARSRIPWGRRFMWGTLLSLW